MILDGFNMEKLFKSFFLSFFKEVNYNTSHNVDFIINSIKIELKYVDLNKYVNNPYIRVSFGQNIFDFLILCLRKNNGLKIIIIKWEKMKCLYYRYSLIKGNGNYRKFIPLKRLLLNNSYLNLLDLILILK